MNVISDLFSFVAVDSIGLTRDRALNQIGEKALVQHQSVPAQ